MVGVLFGGSFIEVFEYFRGNCSCDLFIVFNGRLSLVGVCLDSDWSGSFMWVNL